MDNESIRLKEPIFLQRDKSGKSYICPVCNSGAGRKGTGITQNPQKREQWHCWACGGFFDIFDLIGAAFNLNTFQEQKQKAIEIYGDIDVNMYNRSSETRQQNKPVQDFTDFLLQAEKNNNFEYLLKRGISKETQQRFHIGFIPDWKHPKAPADVAGTPRCIIPRSNSNYLARRTDDVKDYAKQNAGQTSLFNIEIIKVETVKKPIFIVEGEIDAMSIEEVGGAAIGLCSVANRKVLIDYLKEVAHATGFVLMLDNDEAGKKATQELADGLTALNIPFIVAEYDAHDPNELLLKDRQEFESLIFSLQGKELKPATNEYCAADLLEYFKNIENQPLGFEITTGFKGLDEKLYGGLHEGLYIIGAISSLGKTTFTLQIADQISEAGQDVLFFSLEMSKYELIAKSISRNTYDNERKTKDKLGRYMAKDTIQILNNRKYQQYTSEEKKVIAKGIEAYTKQAQNLYIYEGKYKGQRLNVYGIREIINNHIQRTGKKPVVFIDYLQILGKVNERGTDKQNTDESVSELKEISRDFSIPVFAISSFNRDNYNEPVTMASFKESGSIEYSSDVLLGLQYSGMDYINGEKDKDRKERITSLIKTVENNNRLKEPVVIELKCLKNRTGYKFSLGFEMVAAFNHFEEFIDYSSFTPCNANGTPFDNMSNKKPI